MSKSKRMASVNGVAVDTAEYLASLNPTLASELLSLVNPVTAKEVDGEIVISNPDFPASYPQVNAIASMLQKACKLGLIKGGKGMTRKELFESGITKKQASEKITALKSLLGQA